MPTCPTQRSQGHALCVIGLVGGIASGKSLVASELERLGAHVIAADAIGHQVLHEPAIRNQIVQDLGNTCLARDGTIDRALLASLVFGPSAAEGSLQRLEKIVHPAIRHRVEEQLDQIQRRLDENPTSPVMVVLDAPLLLEAGWLDLCKHVVYVDTPWERRVLGAAQRGWTEQQLRQREQAQWPLDRKRASSDMAIENHGSVAELQTQVVQLWGRLCAECRASTP